MRWHRYLVPFLGSNIDERYNGAGENDVVARSLPTTQHVPSAANFVRRMYHSSVTIGDHVYIDGGEFEERINSSYISQHTLTSTLSIDMSKSWSPETVEFSQHDKTNPLLNGQCLWSNGLNTTAYAFGGEVSYYITTPIIPSVEMWQFIDSGSGNVSWEQFKPGQTSIFSSLTRPMGALNAVVDNTAFVIGGYESSRSAPGNGNLETEVQIPGIASFNMSTGTWDNNTLPDRLVDFWGVVAAVPPYGPRGLLAMAGSKPDTNFVGQMDNITLYEPIGKTWHWQIANGAIPKGRGLACAVGIQGENGTFEIFMYGGSNDLDWGGSETPESAASIKSLDEVFVLSLPAFRWFKANYVANYPRIRHKCEIVGNRQMLSIGGLDPRVQVDGKDKDDPCPQGLGIFDLSEMVWKTDTGYDADAPPYTTPEVVQAWYRDNPMNDSWWSDPAVRDFFQQKTVTNNTGSAPAATTNNTAASSDTAKHKTSSKTGAIAGGTVGGVVALVSIAFLILFLRHRRKKRRLNGSTLHSNPYQVYEAHHDTKAQELGGKRTAHEMSDFRSGLEVAEVDGQGKAELDNR